MDLIEPSALEAAVAAARGAGIESDARSVLRWAHDLLGERLMMSTSFQKGGMVAPPPGTLDDARAWIKDEMTMWKQVAEEINLRLDD